MVFNICSFCAMVFNIVEVNRRWPWPIKAQDHFEACQYAILKSHQVRVGFPQGAILVPLLFTILAMITDYHQ